MPVLGSWFYLLYGSFKIRSLRGALIFDTPSHAMKGNAMKKELNQQNNHVGNPIIPANKVINALYACSYYGKDLLEASGKHNKASFLLKEKIEELCNIFTLPAWEKCETSGFYTAVTDMIESFAKFIYLDDMQIRYFVESFVRRFEERLKIELSCNSVLPKII